jgi:hypothetical protein
MRLLWYFRASKLTGCHLTHLSKQARLCIVLAAPGLPVCGRTSGCETPGTCPSVNSVDELAGSAYYSCFASYHLAQPSGIRPAETFSGSAAPDVMAEVAKE